MTKISSRIQSKWQKHVDAHIASGLSQAAYCRQQGISGGSFSTWKQKLNSSKIQMPAVIPVIVKKTTEHPRSPSFSTESIPDEITLKATLPNSVTLEFTLHSASMLTRVLSQLGLWPC